MSSQQAGPSTPTVRQRSSTPVNAVASGSQPKPSTSSPSRPGPPPKRRHGPAYGMDVFEEPFALDEEPTDLHGEDEIPPDVDEQAVVEEGQGEEGGPAAERDSMYVSLFEDMLQTVLDHESYLFTAPELATFDKYKALSYKARYLLIRLLLRLPRVHRLRHLEMSYASEIGKQHVASTMDELCVRLGPSTLPLTGSSSNKGKEREKVREKIVIDLTEEEEKEDPQLARALRNSLKTSSDKTGPGSAVTSNGKQNGMGSVPPDPKGKGKAQTVPGPSGPNLPQTVVDALDLDERPLDLSHFCTLASNGDVSEETLLRSLRLDELKEVARAMKVFKPTLTYNDLITRVLSTATSQSVISFPTIAPPPMIKPSNLPKPPKQTGKAAAIPKAADPKQGTLSFGQRPKLTDGRARLAGVVRGVMGKAIIVNEDIRRLWKRLNLIFYRSTIAPPTLLLPQILSKSHRRTYPTYTPTRTLSLFPTRLSLLSYERALILELEVDDALGEQETLNGTRPFSKATMIRDAGKVTFGGAATWGSSFGSTGGRREGAEVVKAIFEGVWDKWNEEVALAKARGQEGKGARAVTDRFQPGHIFTRIIAKGAYALGILHEYDRECEVLRTLLAQKVWRRGKRGAWYERLALILMTHYKGAADEMDKKEQALDVCMDGLEDPDTHLIYRPSLTRRLTRLEKQLKLRPDECHICEGELKTCETVVLAAKRIRRRVRDKGDESDDEDDQDESIGRRNSRARTAEGEEGEQAPAKKTFSGAKSVWLGRDETEVGVEQWVLEQWENKGWKGFHAEGSILTTLFGLLFWDVLFAPVAGAFETAYQSAPLDLGEDSFALARAPLIATHLARIEAGEAPEILRTVDERERENQTMCVGVRWDFEREDLLEIVECIGGRGLSIVCRMLSEEYAQRNSGVPDLVVWNHEERAIRWSEVKGPGDTLSSTQKVWIDVLLSAGIDVEVCRVIEDDGGPPGKKKRSRSGSVASARSKSVASRAASVESDEYVAEADENQRPLLKKRKSSGGASAGGSGYGSDKMGGRAPSTRSSTAQKGTIVALEEDTSDCIVVD